MKQNPKMKKKIVRYKLDLVGVQEGSGTEPARECTFFYGKGNIEAFHKIQNNDCRKIPKSYERKIIGK
jgi:hypothetical protein